MEIMDFAKRYLSPGVQKKNEIIPELCVFCGGGDNKDKRTFALNIEKKTYKCQRGSCGAKGHYNELLKHFGLAPVIDAQISCRKTKKVVEYKKPTLVTNDAVVAHKPYLNSRGISDATIDKFKITSKDSNTITFPYYDERNELVLVKYRNIADKKFLAEAGGKPILYGSSLCKHDKPLIICEGEIDCLTLHEAGIENVVSVPFGCNNLEFINLQWEWLEKFDTYVIWGDNDEPGQKMVDAIVKALTPEKCKIVKNTTDCKDANDILVKLGKEKVLELYNNAEYIPITGLIDLSKVIQPEETPRIKTGFAGLDKILDGFAEQSLNVWTGTPGSGKSTFLNQIIIESVAQDYKVCIYSGELGEVQLQNWIDFQIAGEQVEEMNGNEFKRYIKKENRDKIHNWYEGMIYLYNDYDHTEEESILKKFDIARRRFGCKVFVVDNLMTTTLSTARDLNEAQTAFMNKLRSFAINNKVVVHLVAHPKKTQNASLEGNDIAGTSNMFNMAHRILSIARLKEGSEYESLLTVIKDRDNGKIGYGVKLNFESKCRRFYEPGTTQWKKYIDFDCPF